MKAEELSIVRGGPFLYSLTDRLIRELKAMFTVLCAIWLACVLTIVVLYAIAPEIDFDRSVRGVVSTVKDSIKVRPPEA